MSFDKLSFEKSWTSAKDFPTYQDSEERVRADMQYHPDALRDYLNNVLIPALEAKTAAASLGAQAANGDGTTVQIILNGIATELSTLAEDITTLTSGGVPAKVRCVPVAFTAESWVGTSDGVSLTIAQSEHKRNDDRFGYNIYQLVDGVYRGGMWGAASTRVTYNDGGMITLAADAAFSGKIVFFGL